MDTKQQQYHDDNWIYYNYGFCKECGKRDLIYLLFVDECDNYTCANCLPMFQEDFLKDINQS